jgi:hypothetical protein
VIVRSRPTDIKSDVSISFSSGELHLKQTPLFDGATVFPDQYLSKSADQDGVFVTMLPQLNDFLDGISQSVLFYGTKGSGKAYSCVGPTPLSGITLQDAVSKVDGFLKRSMERVLEALRDRNHSDRLVLFVFAVSDNNVYDLLSIPMHRSIRLRDLGKEGVLLDGLTATPILQMVHIIMKTLIHDKELQTCHGCLSLIHFDSLLRACRMISLRQLDLRSAHCKLKSLPFDHTFAFVLDIDTAWRRRENWSRFR